MAVWSALIKLFDPNGADASLNMVPERPGVYRIRSPQTICRANGDDSEGILHIGKATDLRYRITQFRGSAKGNRKDHQAGWRFNNYRYLTKFPLDSLCIDYKELTGGKSARQLEIEEHEHYLVRFLDRPPLDSQG